MTLAGVVFLVVVALAVVVGVTILLNPVYGLIVTAIILGIGLIIKGLSAGGP